MKVTVTFEVSDFQRRGIAAFFEQRGIATEKLVKHCIEAAWDGWIEDIEADHYPASMEHNSFKEIGLKEAGLPDFDELLGA